MSERPATRADLRAIAWQWVRTRHVPTVETGLIILARLDADERDDGRAGRMVANMLARTDVVTDPDGRPVNLLWHDPVPA
jgi:hypothetical protein